MKSLMETYKEVTDRAGGVCEGEGCESTHLSMHHLKGKIVNNPSLMKLLCMKCILKMERSKLGKKTSKKKPKETNQSDLF